MATFTTDASGRLVASAPPKMYIPPTQNISGSAIDAASSKTLADQATAAAASKALGVGQKGASRRRRKHSRKHSRKHRNTRRGGAAPNLNAQVPILPEAGTIKGVSHETNHLNATNTLNQLKADAVYDSQINAPPVKLGGRKNNGSRKRRTHRRKHGKSSHRSRGTRRRV